MAEAILLAAGASASTAAAWGTWINLAIAFAGSAYAAKEQRRRLRNAKRDSARDRELTIRSAAANLVSIYGQTRVAGHLVDVFTTGTHQQYLHAVYRLADHQCAAIAGYWFAGQRLTVDAQGWVTNADFVRRTSVARNLNLASDGAGVLTLPYASSSEPVITSTGTGELVTSYAHTLGTPTVTGLAPNTAYLVAYTSTTVEPLIRLRAHLGAPGQQADADLIAESAGRWTSAMRGDGITYVYVRMEFDNLLSPYDAEDWLFEVRGKVVLDPRANAAAWSNNPALIARDWLTDGRLGPGITAADVPASEIIAAANVCDEGVRVQAIESVNAAAYYEPFVAGVGIWSTADAVTTIINSGDGTVRVASTGSDQVIRTPTNGVAIAGSVHRYVRARIKRAAGTAWDGTVYYATAGHGYVGTHFKQVAEPAGGWRVVEWDMHALNAGGADWSSSTITGLRIDLGVGAGDAFDVDWIAVGGSIDQRRYTCDIAITSAQTLGEISDQLMDACAGTLVYAQGQWLVRPGAYRLPALTIDERVVVGGADAPVKVVPVPAKRARYNAVRAYYHGPETNYTELAAPIVRNAQYVAEDGGVEVVQDLRLAHDCDATRAQRLAKIELERHRQGLTCALTTNLMAYDLVPTDVCAVDLQLPGFANKAFVVDSRSWAGTGTLQYTLTETAPEVWQWNDGDATIGDPAPNTVLRSPATPPARITGLALSATAADALRLSDDSYLARVRITWTPVTDTYVTQGGAIEIEWFEVGVPARALPDEPGDAAVAYIAPAPRGVVGVRVRARNAIGVVGPWSAASIDVPNNGSTIDTDVLAPGAVTTAFLMAPGADISTRIRTNSGATATQPGDIVSQSSSVSTHILLQSATNTSGKVQELQIEGYISAIAFPSAVNSWYYDVRLLVAKLAPGETVDNAVLQYAESPRAAMVAHVASKGKQTPPNLNMVPVVNNQNGVLVKTAMSQPIQYLPGETITVSMRVNFWLDGPAANTGDYEITYFGSYARGLILKR